MSRMKLVHQDDRVWIGCGEAADYDGERPDLILTNPYGYLPTRLASVPMVVHQWVHRLEDLKIWCGVNNLELVGTWNDDREAFYYANFHPGQANLDYLRAKLRGFRPEAGGWYPLEMAVLLVTAFGWPNCRIFDGFMGRGTVGKAALELGCKYIGIDKRPEMMAEAMAYIGLGVPA